MQDTPKGSRLHIAIFGRRNAGKSSLINALTKQEIALVSDIPGTTTDPVYKAMEILPIGPVMLIDTAGIDDVGELGVLRVEKTLQVLNKADLAILVIEPSLGIDEPETGLIGLLKQRNIPVVALINKIDTQQLSQKQRKQWEAEVGLPLLAVSAKTGQGIEKLKSELIKAAPAAWDEQPLAGDLLQPGDMAVLVVPIDSAAPKGRLILPQVQTIRDILDHDACSIVTKEDRLKEILGNMSAKPRIVITDSQEFAKVAAETPDDIWLTSFSILMARHKGDLETLVAGAKAVKRLKPGDQVLIAEGCTHHRQADDIGRVKIPRWLKQAVGGDLSFAWVSGGSFPPDLAKYQLIIHCGACMLNRREMLYRISLAREVGVPIINYGVLIAYLHGIMPRALQPFPSAFKMYQNEYAEFGGERIDLPG